MSLRARLLAVLVSLAAVGLIVAGIATYTSLRSFLVARVDRTVTGSAQALARSLERRGSLDPSDVDQLGTSNPGIYIGVIDASGAVRWAAIGARPGEEASPGPSLSPDVIATKPLQTILSAPATSGDTRFRVRLEGLRGGQTLAVAVPLDQVNATLDRLLVIELIVTAAVIGAILLLGLWLVRVGLRPLGEIEQTAAAIAGGDLSRRIENADERTEVGRLGSALNTMLAQIETAFDERTASEQRLRRFVGDASHELRTPLAAVRAYAELFGRGARTRPDDLERAMAGIERESRRMGVLVDDLLLLARLDQGRPLERKPVELEEITRDSIEAALLLDADHPLELVSSGPVVVVGDRERLRQVIDNLLANVRAHTPPGTAATVRVGSDTGMAFIEVADDGPGLTDEQATHVFERFYRGDPSRSRDAGGSGLGLSIIAAIAGSHGGGATVSTRTGNRGLTVKVVVPLEPGADEIDDDSIAVPTPSFG